MIYKLARGRTRRAAIVIIVAAVAVDGLIGQWLISTLTVPLLDELVRRNPEFAGFVDSALSVIP